MLKFYSELHKKCMQLRVKIAYYSVGFTEPALQFWRRIGKRVGRGFANKAQIFNVGFVKPPLYNIFLYILFNIFNYPNVEKKNHIKVLNQNFFYFYATA